MSLNVQVFNQDYVCPITGLTVRIPNASNVGFDDLTSYLIPIFASGGVPPYTYNISEGSQLPAGMGLNTSSGFITGNAENLLGGHTYSFDLFIEDSTVPTPQSTVVTINIQVDDFIVVGPPGEVGSEYSGLVLGNIANKMARFTLPFNYSLSNPGNLNPGLTAQQTAAKINPQDTGRTNLLALAGTPSSAANTGIGFTITDSASPTANVINTPTDYAVVSPTAVAQYSSTISNFASVGEYYSAKITAKYVSPLLGP